MSNREIAGHIEATRLHGDRVALHMCVCLQYISRFDDFRFCSQREFYQYGTADYLNDLRLKSVDEVHLRMLCGPVSKISFVQTELGSKCVLGDVTPNAFMGSRCMKVF